MFNRGQRGRGPEGSSVPEIKLVNMKTEAYEEFFPIYKKQWNSSSYQEDTFKAMIREKFNDASLPLSLRKRKMYARYRDKQKAIELETKGENIFDYLNLSLKITDMPIVMRKHLLSEKIKNGVNYS